MLFSIITCLLFNSAVADETASQLFNDLRKMVYQIRVIDIASGDKSSIGSGFQVSADGRIATNFHVVASYIHKPDKYQLEYVFHDGSTGKLALEGFDVIHDLAIVKRDSVNQTYLSFRDSPLIRGERMYSMGNPLDLGMTIIEGNYNGLLETSRFQKILFSGSLNAGMSGGPAIDENGQVIGINVSKGNEQISFLVPVQRLIALIEKLDRDGFSDDYKAAIQKDLYQDQDNFYSSLVQHTWTQEDFVKLSLPGKISPSLKCWGDTIDSHKIRYDYVKQSCQSQDNIYLDDDLETGSLYYRYEWISSDSLNRFQLYSLLETRFTHFSLNNAEKEDDISNYECDNDFIEIQKRSFRISTCSRGYLEYPDLYDTVIMLVSVDRNNKGAIIRVGATGISRKNSVALLGKFLESIQWKN